MANYVTLTLTPEVMATPHLGSEAGRLDDREFVYICDELAGPASLTVIAHLNGDQAHAVATAWCEIAIEIDARARQKELTA